MKTVVLVLCIVNLGVAGQFDQQRWVEAEREIRRVAPQSYPGLPTAVSRYLRRHGYTIPQTYDTARTHNVVRGQFNGDGVQDWAVLASRGGHSQILVFWGGAAARVTPLARRADADYLQTVGEGTIGYSRGISVVGREYVLEHYRRYGGPRPPAIRHDAINDGFSGKASEVYYFDGKRWYTLQGAD
jgi:hypothetical protein